MKVFFGLVVGMAIGVAAYWYFSNGQKGADLQNTGRSALDAVEQKLKVLDLRSNDIKDELARTGQVVRKKAHDAGQAIADATADARITAIIKGKLLADPELSALSISVNTTAGVVTLSGTVNSPNHIGKAMLLAMEPEGVKEVVSTLQVKNGKG